MAFRTLILLSFLALLAWMEHGRKPRLGILYPVQVGVGGPAWRIDPLLVSDWSGCRALVLRPGKAEHGNTEEACFRKPCLLAAGRRYGMDLMLGGSVERFGDSLLVAWRLIGVESGEDLHVRAEILVECHDFKVPGVTDLLVRRFATPLCSHVWWTTVRPKAACTPTPRWSPAT